MSEDAEQMHVQAHARGTVTRPEDADLDVEPIDAEDPQDQDAEEGGRG